jgi:hypothetical protein
MPIRARHVVAAAAVVSVATACGSGLSAGHASAARDGHQAAYGRPAAASQGIAEARHRAAAPHRRILPCRPAGGTRQVAATACRVPPRAPLPSAAPWRITCPLATAGPSHRARAIVSRPGCRLFCWTKAGALTRCGPIWGCWNAGQQAGPALICAEGTRPPQDATPGAAAGRPAAGSASAGR